MGLIFPQQWLSLIWEILIILFLLPIVCPSNSKLEDDGHLGFNGLCDHLRDVSWDDIFKLGTSAIVTEFCGLVIRLELMYIPADSKYQVKSYSPP